MPWERSADGPHGFEKADGARPAEGFGALVRFEGAQTTSLHALKNNAKGWKSCRRKGCGRVWGRDRPCLTLLSEPVKRKKRKSLASKKIVFGLREKRKEKERYLRDFLPGNSLQTNRACGNVCRVGGRDRRCLTLGCGRVGRVWGRRKGCGRVCRVWGRDRPCLTLLSEPVKRKESL